MKRWLIATTTLGLALRLVAVLAVPITPTEDAADYHLLAIRLAAGDGYVAANGAPTAFRPPAYPVFLAAVYRLTGADPAAARIAQAAVGAALIPLVALLTLALGDGRNLALGDQRGARLAALATALYPPLVSSWFGPRALLSETLLTTLAIAALWLVTLAARGPAPWSLAAGVVSGMALLTKGTLIFWPPLAAIYLLAVGAGQPRAWRKAGLFALGAAVVVLPWTVRNAEVFGRLVPISTNGGISLWASYNPASRGLGNKAEGYDLAIATDDRWRQEGLDEAERSARFMELVMAEIRSRPGRALRLIARKWLLFWDPTLKDWSQSAPPLRYNWGYGALLPLALYGALVAGRRPPRAKWWLVGSFVIGLAVVHAVLHTDVRYRITLEPALVALAGIGAGQLSERVSQVTLAVATGAYVLVHVLIALAYPHVFTGLQTVVRHLGLG